MASSLDVHDRLLIMNVFKLCLSLVIAGGILVSSSTRDAFFHLFSLSMLDVVILFMKTEIL